MNEEFMTWNVTISMVNTTPIKQVDDKTTAIDDPQVSCQVGPAFSIPAFLVDPRFVHTPTTSRSRLCQMVTPTAVEILNVFSR